MLKKYFALNSYMKKKGSKQWLRYFSQKVRKRVIAKMNIIEEIAFKNKDLKIFTKTFKNPFKNKK